MNAVTPLSPGRRPRYVPHYRLPSINYRFAIPALPHQNPSRLDRQLAAPILDQYEADRHAAKMGEMGYPGLGAGNTEKKLDGAVADHEQPRGHRDRRKQQHDALVRVHHAVGEQQTENTAGRAERRIETTGEEMHDRELGQRRADHAYKVVDRERALTQGVFDRAAEHP